MRLGAARSRMPTAWRLVKVEVSPTEPHFTYQLDRKKLRKARLREGRYLLRTNLGGEDPAQLWEYYIRLVEVEQAFKTLKNELAVRPIFHQKEPRIEAHIFIAFLAYCLHATLRLRLRLRRLAPSMTPRSVLEAFTDIQMIDVQVPTTDGRHLQMSRYTEPGDGLRVLIELLKLQLPGQPPPRISAAAAQSSPPL